MSESHSLPETEHPAPPGLPPTPEVATPPAGSGGASAAPPPSKKAVKIGTALAVLGLIAGAVWYFAIRTPEPRDDLERFQGVWHLVTAGQGNRSAVTVRVTGDRWVYLFGSQEQKKYRLTLRTEANPKEIDLTQLGPDDQPSAFVLRGIYAFEGDGAKVLVAPDPLPRPTALGTTDDPSVWVLERP